MVKVYSVFARCHTAALGGPGYLLGRIGRSPKLVQETRDEVLDKWVEEFTPSLQPTGWLKHSLSGRLCSFTAMAAFFLPDCGWVVGGRKAGGWLEPWWGWPGG